MKKDKHAEQFLEELKKIPIVHTACGKAGVSRNTVYRWKREDKEFAKQFEEALAEGVEFVNDMSENQLLQLIKDKNFSAVRFWLNKRHPAYKDKVEVMNVGNDSSELTDEQAKVVRHALQLASIIKPNTNDHGKD